MKVELEVSCETAITMSGNTLDRLQYGALTDRSFKTHLQDLEITLSDLGKFVLDLGSGESERFADGAKKYGITVISLNPLLAFTDIRTSSIGIMGIIKKRLGFNSNRKSVAAIARALPFKSKIFETVISDMAVPEYLDWKNRADFELCFSEIVRVLKKDGKAYLGPGHKHHSFIYQTLARLKAERLIDYDDYDPNESQSSSVIKFQKIS